MRVGLICARDNAAVSAIVKQPACAAPINSSGLVADSPSSNRDLNEYGPSKAPLPTFNRPLPSARLPNHSASAFLDGINVLFSLSNVLLKGCAPTRYREVVLTVSKLISWFLAAAATGSSVVWRRRRGGFGSVFKTARNFPLASSPSQSHHR